MRKLKLQVQTSIDGFIAGPNHEMDWLKFPWSPDIMDYVKAITDPVDTILLGKNLAQGFIPHWENVVKNPTDPEYEGGLKYSNTPKVVFSKTLQTSEWKNTRIAERALEDEVTFLKQQTGGDLIAYGGSQFVSSLIQHQLIDEYHLFVNPTAIGNGLPIFHAITGNLTLQLDECRKFDGGIALMKYSRIQ